MVSTLRSFVECTAPQRSAAQRSAPQRSAAQRSAAQRSAAQRSLEELCGTSLHSWVPSRKCAEHRSLPTCAPSSRYFDGKEFAAFGSNKGYLPPPSEKTKGWCASSG